MLLLLFFFWGGGGGKRVSGVHCYHKIIKDCTCTNPHKSNIGSLLGVFIALLTKCEVKMAGYWPSSFFFAFLWNEKKSIYIISSHLDQTSLVKEFCFNLWEQSWQSQAGKIQSSQVSRIERETHTNKFNLTPSR